MEPKEENDQNLQDIIDTVVSRQASYSSSAEDLIFWETDDEDESVADLFVAVNDNVPDSSDAPNVAYATDSGYIMDVTDIAFIDDDAEDDGIAFTDEDADDDDIAYADEDANEEDNADDENETDVEDSAEVEKEANVEDDEEVEKNTDVEDYTGAEDNTVAEDIAQAYDGAKAGNVTEAADALYIANAPNPEGRLIFLSRTLSGLVDMFLIALFSGIFLGAADYFTNTPILSSVSAISFTALFLMIYFLYSFFFVGTNGQTIGMIMTDLRVVSINENPLSMSQVIRRNTAFLVSLFGFGIGLFIGVFNRKCQCMHDRISETCVIRTLGNAGETDF